MQVTPSLTALVVFTAFMLLAPSDERPILFLTCALLAALAALTAGLLAAAVTIP